jgi:hypothetical protein
VHRQIGWNLDLLEEAHSRIADAYAQYSAHQRDQQAFP